MATEKFALEVGDIVTDDSFLQQLREDVTRMCNMDQEGVFPVLGSQPVSMDRDNMRFLSFIDYCVCEKTDGERYLLLIWNKKMYFIDREYNFCEIKNIKLDNYTNPPYNDCINFSKATVLDGELLRETKADKPFLCFWVFDIICYNSNRKAAELSLLNRLHLIRTSVVEPIHSHDVILPFKIRMKPMYNLEQTVFVWRDVVQHLTHECDGLIFTPIKDVYKAGACLKLLKWKPDYLNSADFKIYLCYTNKEVRYRLQVRDRGMDTNFDWISFENEEEESIYGHSGVVAECIFDRERWTYIPYWDGKTWTFSPKYADSEKGPGWRKGGWKPIRRRSDKTQGNALRTVENVMKSIMDDIQISELDDLIKSKSKKCVVCSITFLWG